MARRRKLVNWPSVADEVLLVPKRALEGPAPAIRNRKAKGKSKAKKKPPRKTRTPYVAEWGALDPFGKHSDLLVRTALVRPRGYKPGRGPLLSTPLAAADLCKHMVDYDDEYFVTLVVNSKNQLLAIYEAAKGGAASASVDLRSILKIPLLVGGRAVVTCHNHPSGDPTPSPDDVSMHVKVREALDCIGIELLDYVIVAEAGFYSYLEATTLRWG